MDDPNPGGLKRMDWSQVRDLEVVQDREASTLPEDEFIFMGKQIRPLLAGTSLEKEPLRLAYDANEDGWNPG